MIDKIVPETVAPEDQAEIDGTLREFASGLLDRTASNAAQRAGRARR